jgi:hypothetical protein
MLSDKKGQVKPSVTRERGKAMDVLRISWFIIIIIIIIINIP